MTSPRDALAEYRMLRQREAILEAQLALGAKQQNDEARANAALEASRSNQARRDAEIADHHRKQEIQRRHDEAFEAHNLTTPMPRADESSSAYHRRLLRDHLQKYSPEYRAVDLNHVPPNMLENVATKIVADALLPVSHSFDVPAGQIKEIVRRDEGGRRIHEFVSSDGTTFIQQMARPRQIVSRFFGRDRIGSASTRPVEKPVYAGRMALRGGLPSVNPPLLQSSGIVVRVANSFTASKTSPFQALKGWCRIHVVGGTGAHPSHLGSSVQSACCFLPARIGRSSVLRGFILIPRIAGGLFLRHRPCKRQTITENRDARSPISSHSQQPFPFAWGH